MPKTVFASGVGRCLRIVTRRFRAFDRLPRQFQICLFSSRGRQLDLDFMGLSLVVAELVRFLFQRILRRRDEGQDAIAFVASIGDFDLLLLRAFEHRLEFLADGDRRIARDSRRPPTGAIPAACSACSMAFFARVPTIITRMIRMPTRLATTSRNESCPGASTSWRIVVSLVAPSYFQTAAIQQHAQLFEALLGSGRHLDVEHRLPVAAGYGDAPAFHARPELGDQRVDFLEHATFHQDDVGGARFTTVRQNDEAIGEAGESNGPNDAGRIGRVLRQPPVATARLRHRRDAGTDLRSGDTRRGRRAPTSPLRQVGDVGCGFSGHRAAGLTVDKAAVATPSKSPGPGSGRPVTRLCLRDESTSRGRSDKADIFFAFETAGHGGSQDLLARSRVDNDLADELGQRRVRRRDT